MSSSATNAQHLTNDHGSSSLLTQEVDSDQTRDEDADEDWDAGSNQVLESDLLQQTPKKKSFSQGLRRPIHFDLPQQFSATTPNSSRRRRRTLYQDLDGSSLGTHTPSTLDGSPDLRQTKGLHTIDWYEEGPGRRVGYDDLTAIDWIYEYAKERQRLRILRSTATGLLGYIRRFADASQIWCILILTGIATGLLAASIDVATDWLGDLKVGLCTHGDGGGKFYLNRAFCCWGLEQYAQCRDWHDWPELLRVSSRSGAYVIGFVFFVLLSVTFAAGASVLVKQFSIDAKQSGIPELKTVLGGFVMQELLGSWVLIVKSLGLCLSVASGLWVGKEGPLVHVACCCASQVIKLFPTLSENEARKREVLSAAAAAGISVAFGAPVGGVLFSLEQLSYYFPDKTMWQSFVCAMIAAVSLQAFNPFRTGKLVLYQVTYSSGWHAFELGPFIVLGVIGGLYGGLFIKLNMRLAKWRRKKRWADSPVFEVIAIAALTAMINYPNTYMRAQFPELVATLFSECSDLIDERLGLCGHAPMPAVVFSLISASILGFFLTTLTFGLHIPAGIILPSMAVGALYGRAIGLMMRTWHSTQPTAFLFATCEPDVPCVTSGTYAIIGAASALAGATRMTVSIVVIMFELTGALTYVLPIMISVMVSKWVGDAFGQQGIYESWIAFNGYPFLDNRDDTVGVNSIAADAPVAIVMTQLEELVILPATGHTLASLSRLLADHPFRGFPVVTNISINQPFSADSDLLLGYISRTELAYALSVSRSRGLPDTTSAFFRHQPHSRSAPSLDLRPWMDQTPITLSAKASLQMACSVFLKLGLRYLLFVDRGMLRGMLTKKDMWLLIDGSGINEDQHFTMNAQKHQMSREAETESVNRREEERGLLARERNDGRDHVRLD